MVISKARSDYLKSEKRKARYQAHKEEEKAKRRARYQAHKEVEKAKRKIYYQTHKEEEKAKRKARYYRPLVEAELKEKTLLIDLCKEIRLYDRIRSALKRGYGYFPLNIPFRGSCIHHLHEEHNNFFCVHIPLFLHELIPHTSKTGTGMQSINAVALSYWLIDYQFFKDD